MKVGVLQFFSWPERRVPLEAVYARALERIDVMEASGYDAVWLAEHHFTSYSVCPSVHMMATHVAARTRRLRIGTAVSLAPLYHPLRLAEEVALLDVLCGGRVNWGAGRGFEAREFEAFGVPVEESRARLLESFDIVVRAWTSERLDYRGRFHSFEGVEVLPKPLQKPHPPVWLAASSPDAIRAAAERGVSILMDPHSSHADIGRKRALYRDTLAQHGHTLAGRDLPIARLIAVAETEAEAARTARQAAEWTIASYAGRVAAGVADSAERYLDGVIVHGTPPSVVDQLARLREEIGLEYLLCAPLSHASFLLFTEKVLPALL